MTEYEEHEHEGYLPLGEPITTDQFAWAVLSEIHSPVVGNLATYSTPGYAIQYCKRREVWSCLSGGEKHLVDIAHSFYSNANHGDGLIALTGLDKMLRRKVWIAIGYLILGRDILNTDLENVIDWSRYRR
jgi:hypothetical protein